MAGKGSKNTRSPDFKARSTNKTFDKSVAEWCNIENITFECNNTLILCGKSLNQSDIIDRFQFKMLKKDNAWATK